jgi:signal transduction histidine kinase
MDIEKKLLKALASKRELNEVLGTSLEILVNHFDIQACAVFLYNPSMDRLKLESQTGFSAEFLNRVLFEGIDNINYKEFSLIPPNDKIFIQHNLDFSGIIRNLSTGTDQRYKLVILTLKINNMKRGYLWLIRKEQLQFSIGDMGILMELGEVLPILIEKAQIHSELLRTVEQLERLINVQNAVLMDLDIDGILKRILREILNIFKPDLVEIVIKGENVLNTMSSDENLIEINVDSEKYSVNQNIIEILQERKDIIIFEETEKENLKLNFEYLKSINSCVLLPIIIQRNIEGFFIIGKTSSHYFQKEDIPLFTAFSVLTSQAIYIAKLHQNILKLQNQLFQASKMESIGILAGGIAHDFNNALTGIIGSADLIETITKNDPKLAKITRLIRESSQKMANWTKQLLAYARGGNYQVRSINLNNAVEKAIEIIEGGFKEKVTILTGMDPELKYINADLSQMEQVVTNILLNSIEAISENGLIKIVTENLENDDSMFSQNKLDHNIEYIRLTITDNGCGMDEKVKDHVFEPFFTTKFQGRGLGLSAVYGIIENHSGKIFIDSSINSGTTIDIYLPVRK